MKSYVNEHLLDRGMRLLLAELFFLGGYFWLGGLGALTLYLLGSVLLLTGLIGYCPLYTVLHFSTASCGSLKRKKLWYGILFVLLLALPIGGAYGSMLFTKKIFLENYGAMNTYYKQTLFYTGKDNREESIKNYEQFLPRFKDFKKTYEQYRPYAIKGDMSFTTDLQTLEQKVLDAQEKIYKGNLPELHKELEYIRPIFQNILKRNNFSMLAVALVDFHDSMEKVLDGATAKNAEEVIHTYLEANEKLQQVEGEAKDAEILQIRTNLEAVLKLAKEGTVEKLPAAGDTLKASFVKVYLQRG